jgi:hypothetical protein
MNSCWVVPMSKGETSVKSPAAAGTVTWSGEGPVLRTMNVVPIEVPTDTVSGDGGENEASGGGAAVPVSAMATLGASGSLVARFRVPDAGPVTERR